MNKQDYAKDHGLRVRKATASEAAERGKSGYVIESAATMRRFWSDKGTLNDLKMANAVINGKPPAAAKKKPAATVKKKTAAPKKPTTTTSRKATTAKKTASRAGARRK